jgi:hypothetical protein
MKRSEATNMAIPVTIVIMGVNYLAYFINKWCLCGSIPLTIYILLAIEFDHVNPLEIWKELKRGN